MYNFTSVYLIILHSEYWISCCPPCRPNSTIFAHPTQSVDEACCEVYL